MSSRVQLAARLMNGFAERTGLGSARPPRRYLWTDAFAVCNLLGLATATGDGGCLERALALVDQVHHVLGRHRPDGTRRGWISGLSEAEGERHPTRGGLRIGKPLPEREAGEAFDARREWDRDGQYFHYLTRWMHALDQVARATGQAQFNTWALELAEAAHAGFVRGDRRMAWKMSIDLSRPLVASMGQHDPLDGFLTIRQLRATGARFGAGPARGQHAEAAFAQLAEGHDWVTDDALGIGGLLVDAFRVEQLAPGGALTDALLAAAHTGLARWRASGDLELPAEHRLGFRELGLAIGLHAVELLAQRHPNAGEGALGALSREMGLAEAIEATWTSSRNQAGPSWRDHLDINEVMLATALAPEGYLVLPEPVTS